MKKIKIIIMLLASIIVVVFSILQNYSLKKLSYTLLIVVILFYIIGTLLQYFLNKIIKDSTEHKTIDNNLSTLETEIKDQIDNETSKDL